MHQNQHVFQLFLHSVGEDPVQIEKFFKKVEEEVDFYTLFFADFRSLCTNEWGNKVWAGNCACDFCHTLVLYTIAFGVTYCPGGIVLNSIVVSM